MKKLTRIVCLVVIISLFVAIPAHAENTIDTKGSAFFAAYGTDLYKTGSTTFQIWFDVDANASTMQVLGVSEIAVYRSADQQSWTKVKTYLMADYPEMIDQNTSSYINYVAYKVATPSCYYRARVTFYAKNSSGIGERDIYTEILRM